MTLRSCFIRFWMRISFPGSIPACTNGTNDLAGRESLRSCATHLSRQLTTHDVNLNQLMTIEAMNDEDDLVADRNLCTGEIVGLREVRPAEASVRLSIDVVCRFAGAGDLETGLERESRR